MISDFRAAVLADAPKAFWLLDLADMGQGAPGFPSDLTGHGYGMTASSGNPATNIVFFAGTPIPPRGATMGAAFTNSEFSGPFVPTPASWAYEVWFGSGVVSSGSYTIFYNGHWTGASGGDGVGLALGPSGNLFVAANGFNDHLTSPPTLTQASGYNQLAMSYDSATHGISFWLNTVAAPGNPYTAWSALPAAPTTAAYIAKNQGASFTTAHVTDATLAVWDHTITGAQVLAHYNAMWALSDADYDFLSYVQPSAGFQIPAGGRVTII